MSSGDRPVAAAVAAAASALSYRALPSLLSSRAQWERTNYRGRRVSLLEGPALAAGLSGAALTTPGLRPRDRAAALVAILGAAAVGRYDDQADPDGPRGLAGHLRALGRGRATSGVVKIGGLLAAGALASRLANPSPHRGRLLGGAVIAAAANVVNLFDLRPGRAAKAAALTLPWLISGEGTPGTLASAVAGCLAVLTPVELAEQTMLGDAGANPLGAVLGLAAVTRLRRRGRAVALGALVLLTLASEVTSFSAVIEEVPALRWLDRLGRDAP